MSYLNQFLFGIFPYVALAVFFVGSLVRFDRDQYTWKSDSSQMLRAGQLRWGSNLFHIASSASSSATVRPPDSALRSGMHPASRRARSSCWQ